MSSQNKILLQKFNKFITTIINAEKLTDQLKSQLFQLCQSYNSIQLPRQIWTLLAKNNQTEISFSNLNSFCQSQNLYLTNKEKKTISKYFGFHVKPVLIKANVYNILKSKGSNSQVKNSQISVKNCLISLIKKVLTDFNQIDLSRKANINQCRIIQGYFQKNYQTSRGLSVQALKQYMYQSGLYSRLNLNFIKHYIFGQNSFILWSELFSAKDRQIEQIKELQEEQLESHKILSIQTQNNSEKLQYHQNDNDKQLQRINLQCHKTKGLKDLKQNDEELSQKIEKQNSQIKQVRSIEKYNNKKLQHALTQIDQIQQLLKKQKQKYQIETTQLKQIYNQQKNQSILSFLNKRPIQSSYPILPIKSDEQKNLEISSKQSSLKSSIIFYNGFNQQQLSTISDSSTKREAGKIKRRISLKHNNHDSTIISHTSLNQNSSQILEKIRKQEEIYNQLKDQKNIFCKNKQTKLQLQKIKQKNYKLQLIKPQHIVNKSLTGSQLETSILQRKDNFYIRQTNRSTSRSRISSQKRQQIVKKATSEAKLKIQQIQKRAMSRISKQMQQNAPQYKITSKNNQNVRNFVNPTNEKHNSQKKQAKIVKNESLLSKYLLSDLLSHRPYSMNLRLDGSNVYSWSKYRNGI